MAIRPSQPTDALAEMMARDREDEPFGGWAGELAAPRTAPPPPAPEPLVIPRPDWDQEVAERALQETAPAAEANVERVLHSPPSPDDAGTEPPAAAVPTPNLDRARELLAGIRRP